MTTIGQNHRIMRAYSCVWIVHQCVQLTQQGFLFGPWRSICGLLIAVVAAEWMLSVDEHRCFQVALVGRNVVRLYQMPFLWDSEYWCLLTDAAVIWSIWSKNNNYRTTIRYQWGVLYIAAGVWKLNSGFLSSTTSCGCIFSAQVVGLPLPGLPVALLEIAIGILFFIQERNGIYLCLAFHAAVALTPKPNGVPTFSLIAATRLIPFCGDLHWNWISPIIALLFEDNATKVFFALAPMILMSKPLAKRRHEQHQRRGLDRIIVFAACLYAGLPILGLQDIGAPTMFGNLKVHGGSNHYFLPTGLLQQSFASPDNMAFGGGVVRIEETNSLFLQQLYPGEFRLDPTVTEILQEAGHVGREFGPKARRILGQEIRSRMPLLPFTPYTIPFLELRRMVQEAPRPFTITVTYLGIKGDEVWRRSSGQYTVEWTIDKTAKPECLSGACDSALDPTIPPPWWSLKWMLFASYAVVNHTSGTNDILCNY